MPGIPVGQPAPSFRLPSAQGPEIALDDYRGKQNLIVWFTKGMGCPFCRPQMSQLARVYDEIRKRGAEVLEITASHVPRARLYAQKFRLPFPYLCDPDLRVRAEWQLDSREHGLGHYAVALWKGMTAPRPENEFGTQSPTLDEMRNVLHDEDMGFFIVDKQGVVRYQLAGASVGEQGYHRIPSNDEILAELGNVS